MELKTIHLEWLNASIELIYFEGLEKIEHLDIFDKTYALFLSHVLKHNSKF